MIAWMLIVCGHAYAGFCTQIGPFADLQSCQTAMHSGPLNVNTFRAECVNVKIIH